jgi:hypothetical protein
VESETVFVESEAVLLGWEAVLWGAILYNLQFQFQYYNFWAVVVKRILLNILRSVMPFGFECD